MDAFESSLLEAARALQAGQVSALERALNRCVALDAKRFEPRYLAYWGAVAFRSPAATQYEQWKDKLPHADHFMSVLRGRKASVWRQRPEWSLRIDALTTYLEFLRPRSFIISYPKCGRTWLRLLLGQVLSGSKTVEVDRHGDLAGITAARPDTGLVEVSHDDYPHWKPAREIRDSRGAYAGKKVAFLVRDPRDTVVSMYMQLMHRDGKRRFTFEPPLPETLSGYLRSDYGIPNIVRFFNVWARERGKPREFLLLRYEDLIGQPGRETRRLLEFLGVQRIDEDLLQAAVGENRFENLQRIERSMQKPTTLLGAVDKGNPESLKMRKGGIGGHKEYMSAEDLAWSNRYLAGELDDYYAGYK